MKEAGYKKLVVWQKADELAYQIYLATKKFPKEEIFGITSQLRKAVLSVPTNIVEGYARHSKNELRHFINISLASLAEVDYLLSFSLRLRYLSIEEHSNLQNFRDEVGRLLWNFYKSI